MIAHQIAGALGLSQHVALGIYNGDPDIVGFCGILRKLLIAVFPGHILCLEQIPQHFCLSQIAFLALMLQIAEAVCPKCVFKRD